MVCFKLYSDVEFVWSFYYNIIYLFVGCNFDLVFIDS